MNISRKAVFVLAICLAGQSARAWDADCGEAVTPNNSIAGKNNDFVTVAQTPVPPPVGIYLACGNFTAKAFDGTTITTRHGDVGLNPASIDTAPAGGSSNGDHRPIPGEPAAYSMLTFTYPTGCRLLSVNGSQNIYAHQITSWTPQAAPVTMSGSLMWCKLR